MNVAKEGIKRWIWSKKKWKKSPKELCHRTNECGATEIYVIQQRAQQVYWKKMWFYTQFMQYGMKWLHHVRSIYLPLLLLKFWFLNWWTNLILMPFYSIAQFKLSAIIFKRQVDYSPDSAGFCIAKTLMIYSEILFMWNTIYMKGLYS